MMAAAHNVGGHIAAIINGYVFSAGVDKLFPKAPNWLSWALSVGVGMTCCYLLMSINQ